MPHFLEIFFTVYPKVSCRGTGEHEWNHLNEPKYDRVVPEAESLLRKRVSHAQIVEIDNSINHQKDNDGFEEPPLFYHFEYFVQGWLVGVVAFLLFDYTADFGDLVLASVEYGNPAQNLLSLLLLVVIHQDIRWLVQEEEKPGREYCQGNELEIQHKIQPVKFHIVQNSDYEHCWSPKLITINYAIELITTIPVCLNWLLKKSAKIVYPNDIIE